MGAAEQVQVEGRDKGRGKREGRKEACKVEKEANRKER